MKYEVHEEQYEDCFVRVLKPVLDEAERKAVVENMKAAMLLIERERMKKYDYKG